MLTKITKIYLYTDESEASQEAKAWCEAQGLVHGAADFIINHYGPGSEEHHQLVFDSLSTWHWADGQQQFTSFPFLYYSEVHDDAQPGDALPMRVLVGLDEIQDSNIGELYQLGRG